MLLCRTWLLSGKPDRTRAAIILPHFVRTILRFSKNLLCPSQLTAQHVPPDSPEAFLLTELRLKKNITIVNYNEYLNTHANISGQRPAGKRGPGCFACGWKDFSGLMFGYFASKVK